MGEIFDEASPEQGTIANVAYAELSSGRSELVEGVHEEVNHHLEEEIEYAFRRKQPGKKAKVMRKGNSREVSNQHVEVVAKETSSVTVEDREHEKDKAAVNMGFACNKDLSPVLDEDKIMEGVAAIGESRDGEFVSPSSSLSSSEIEVLDVDHQHLSVVVGTEDGSASGMN